MLKNCERLLKLLKVKIINDGLFIEIERIGNNAIGILLPLFKK